MNIDETLSYIHAVCWRGQRPGAGAHRRAAGPDGRPAKKQMRFIHVTGTNGKGLYLRHDGQHPSGGRLSDGAVYVPLS